MSDYIKSIEQQNEELQSKLAKIQENAEIISKLQDFHMKEAHFDNRFATYQDDGSGVRKTQGATVLATITLEVEVDAENLDTLQKLLNSFKKTNNCLLSGNKSSRITI